MILLVDGIVSRISMHYMCVSKQHQHRRPSSDRKTSGGWYPMNQHVSTSFRPSEQTSISILETLWEKTGQTNMDRALWQMRHPGFRNPKSDLPLEKNCIAALRIGFKNHPAQLPSSDKMHIFVNECNLGDYIDRREIGRQFWQPGTCGCRGSVPVPYKRKHLIRLPSF